VKPVLLNHFGLSGGKDSTALMLWAINESGSYPLSLVFSWCDTGNENEYTEAYINYLSAKLHRIHVTKPPLGFYDLARKRKRFPSARARFCTQELKIYPTQRYIAGLIAKGFDVRLHTGVRAAESPDRAALPAREWDTFHDCEMYRPILSWSLENVWAIHERYGIPPNPLYGLTAYLPWKHEPNPFFEHGSMRVGCDPCIMSRKQEVGHMARYRPSRITFISTQEKSVRNRCGYSSFFARDKIPLCQRSKSIVTKDGRDMKVATIDDVARWSQTSHGGVQYVLNLPMTAELVDEAPSCSSRYGMCE